MKTRIAALINLVFFIPLMLTCPRLGMSQDEQQQDHPGWVQETRRKAQEVWEEVRRTTREMWTTAHREVQEWWKRTLKIGRDLWGGMKQEVQKLWKKIQQKVQDYRNKNDRQAEQKGA
jgi:hypothetical protein